MFFPPQLNYLPISREFTNAFITPPILPYPGGISTNTPRLYKMGNTTKKENKWIYTSTYCTQFPFRDDESNFYSKTDINKIDSNHIYKDDYGYSTNNLDLCHRSNKIKN